MSELLIGNQLIASLMLIALGTFVRWFAVRHLRKMHLGEDELPRRWINSVKKITNFLIASGLVIIWLTELRFVALSIATFAVALVIATREFIQCFLGSIYQSSSRSFVVGDWVKIGSSYGEVVNSDWLTTTLHEVDIESLSYAYTGKTLSIPNHQLMGSTIQNLNFMRRYVPHSFAIVRDAEPINPFLIRDAMIDKAKTYCEPFEEVGKRYSDLIEGRLGVVLQGPSPEVRITTTNLGKNVFTIGLFCPTNQAVNIEQKLIEDFMELWYTEVEKAKAAKKESKKAEIQPGEGTESE